MRWLLTAIACCALSSCFTGVESTPRIVANEREQQPTLTEADTLLRKAAPEPFANWEIGKVWTVTDNRFRLLLSPNAPEGTMKDMRIAFAGWRLQTSPTGAVTTELLFTPEGGTEPLMVYPVAESPRQLTERGSVEIPFAIEESMVETARQLLAGRTLYVLTNRWRSKGDTILPGGRRFVAVRVEAVMPGTSAAPLRIDFSELNGSSGGSLFVNPDPEAKTPRTFARQFSLTDPRRIYPDITPEHWTMITEGRIAPGMTTRECRLSLGAPKDITRHTNYSIMQERWVYENGVWLLFEDDILIDHRK